MQASRQRLSGATAVLSFQGRVTDARMGRPIEGARVAEGWTGQHYLETDADGRYDFPHFTRQGVYEFHVFAGGYGKASRALYDPREGTLPTDGLDFALEPGYVLEGTLTDAAGKPLVGAYVAAAASESRDGLQHVDWRADHTDEQGRFRVEDMRRDVRHLQAAARESSEGRAKRGAKRNGAECIAWGSRGQEGSVRRD